MADRNPTRAVYLTEEEYAVVRRLVEVAENEAFNQMMKGADPVARREGEARRALLKGAWQALFDAKLPQDDREPENRPRRARRPRRKEGE